MDCRGEEKRRKIVAEYLIEPVAHLKLLNGQKKHSDAGQTILNDYYIFEATKRADGTKETIQCGMGAAKDFLRRINHKGLPIFNPLCGEMGSGDSGEKGVEKQKSNNNWDCAAKQLYNACMWLITIIDIKSGCNNIINTNSPIFRIKKEVYEKKNVRPTRQNIKGVNTIASKLLGKKTLTERILELGRENQIRDELCQFGLLIEAINTMTDSSGNKIESAL